MTQIAAPGHRLLDEPRFSKGRQSWDYEAHFDLATERPSGSNTVNARSEVVRVRIHVREWFEEARNQYVFQSSAVLDVYDPGARVWNPLARLLPGETAVCALLDGKNRSVTNERVSYVHSAERLNAFVEDAERLLALGETILRAAP